MKIALVGDWGTGQFTDGEALSIMTQIMGHSPDYLIHLGDVYYAGTTGDFLPSNEEMNNFLNDWPNSSQLPAGNSFMLNSNHEMYSGAKGYFNVGLADQRFSQQQGTSYFALQYAGWTILGLDSAYYSPGAMFMSGIAETAALQEFETSLRSAPNRFQWTLWRSACGERRIIQPIRTTSPDKESWRLSNAFLLDDRRCLLQWHLSQNGLVMLPLLLLVRQKGDEAGILS